MTYLFPQPFSSPPSFRTTTHREVDQLLQLSGIGQAVDRVIEQGEAQVLAVKRVGRGAVVDGEQRLWSVGGADGRGHATFSPRCTPVSNWGGMRRIIRRDCKKRGEESLKKSNHPLSAADDDRGHKRIKPPASQQQQQQRANKQRKLWTDFYANRAVTFNSLQLTGNLHAQDT